jgi:dienelactone hydrolase
VWVAARRCRPSRPTAYACSGSTSEASRPRRAPRTVDPTASRRTCRRRSTLHADGARQVLVIGASFGGAATLRAAAKLHGVTGFVSLSGELDLPTIGNVLPAVRRLRAPLLVVASRRDYYFDAGDAKRLLRAAGSPDKQLALYSGSYHGWDLLEQAPFRERVWSRLLGWIDEH